jgi:prefoldin beta subunit
MAETTLPPAVQQQLAQLQQQNAQLQAMAQQRAQFEAMKAEGEQALQALEALPDAAPVYRSVGAFLVQEPGKAAAVARLKDDQETLEIRIGRLQKQETALRDAMQALQARLQTALKG